MHIRKSLILLSLMLCSAVAVRSQESRTSISVGYRVNSTELDTLFMENGTVMRELSEYLSTLRQDSTVRLIGVTFRGSASPEGSYELNHSLARRRLRSLEDAVRREIGLPDSLITREDGYIAWDHLASVVSSSARPYRDTVLSILSQEPFLVDYPGRRHIDRRIPQLQSLMGGVMYGRT